MTQKLVKLLYLQLKKKIKYESMWCHIVQKDF